MAKYIKSHSNYVVAKKHQDINDGVVYERDITTIGGLDQFAKGQRPIYKSSNFIITVNNENEAPRDISLNRWQHTNDGEFWTLADIIKNKKTDTLEIKNKPDFYNLRDFAYYGSCTELIRASLNNIIKNFPGELYAVENPYDGNNSEQENGLIVYYCDSNGEKQILSGETRGASISQKELNTIQYKFLLDNPFNIDIHTPDIDIDETETNFLRFFANQSFINFDLLIYNQYTGEYDKNEIELWEINDPYTRDDDEEDNIVISEGHIQIENGSATYKIVNFKTPFDYFKEYNNKASYANRIEFSEDKNVYTIYDREWQIEEIDEDGNTILIKNEEAKELYHVEILKSDNDDYDTEEKYSFSGNTISKFLKNGADVTEYFEKTPEGIDKKINSQGTFEYVLKHEDFKLKDFAGFGGDYAVGSSVLGYEIGFDYEIGGYNRNIKGCYFKNALNKSALIETFNALKKDYNDVVSKNVVFTFTSRKDDAEDKTDYYELVEKSDKEKEGLGDGSNNNTIVVKSLKTCLQVGDILKEITIRYGENPEEQFIQIGAFIGPDKNIVYLVSENDLGIRIRPKEELIEYYFNNLDSFEEVLLNRDSTPLYKATFEIQKESPFGLKSEIIDFVFPKGYGDYNICVNGGAYNSYVDRLNEIGENYDELFCDNLYKSMTHESIKNFDWTFTREYQNGEEAEYVIGGSKIEKLIKLFGREFDEIKTYIDGLKNYNRITYNDKNNIPNYFLTDELENDGWDIVNIYPKTMHEYIINEYEAYIDVTDNLTPSERLRGVYENNSRDKNIEHVIRGFKDDDETLIKPYTSLNQYFSIYNSDEFFNAEGTQYFGYYLKDKDYTTDNTLTISGITLDLTKESPFYGYDETIIDNEEDGTSYTSYNRSKDNKITFTSTFLNEKTGSYIYDEPNEVKKLGGCLKPKIMSYNSEKEYNMKEVNDHFMKMLKLNSKFLLRKKGTIDGIEEMLSLFGLRSKRWYDSLNPIIKQRIDEQRGDVLQYDYEITETTSITPPIIDRWCDDRKMFYIDWCNYCKNITYNTEDFRLGIYTPYRGLPVSYETHFDSYRYLYPFFDSSKEIDGGMYYQMDGGWMSRAPYAFDSQDNLMINTEDNKCYKRTVKDILIVDNIQDLLSLPSTSLYNNQICKVLNMDGEYVIVDGELYDVYIEFSNNREYRFIEVEYDGSGVLSLGAINLSGFIKYSVRDDETMLLDVQDLRMGEKLRVYLQPIIKSDFSAEFGESLIDVDTSSYLKTKDGFIVFDDAHKPILIDDTQAINELKEWNFTEVGGYFVLDDNKNLIKRVDYDIYFDYLSERFLVGDDGELVFDEYFNLIPKNTVPDISSFDWPLDDDVQSIDENEGIALADEPIIFDEGIALADEPIIFDEGIALADGPTPVADNLEAEGRSEGYNDNPEQAEIIRQDGELDADVIMTSEEPNIEVIGYQILFNYANYDNRFLPIDFIYYTNKDIKESQYFKLIDKNYSNEISINGWEQISYDSEDYKEYVLVQDYFNGNNPHNSQIAYDNGEAYMEKFYHLFGYSVSNNLFNLHLLHNESINIYLKGDVSNNEPYKQAFYMSDTMVDVKNIGFHCLNEEWDEECKKDYLKYAINNDPKIHYFGKVFDTNNLEYETAISSDETYREKVNYFTENVESDVSAKDVETSSINENDGIALASFDDLMVVNEAIVDEKENTNSYTKSNKDESMYALSWNNSTPLWEISDTLDNNSDQIVNTKVVTIKFKRFKQDDLYSKESVEEIKYLDSVIMHYVEQMIPSTTILQVDYDGLK